MIDSQLLRILRRVFTSCVVPLGFLALTAAQNNADVAVLIVSSSHSFDTALEPLKFAGSDGSRFADIMVTVGRVPKDHFIFLNDATSTAMPGAIERINKILAGCVGCASKFIFYYSGHADENGLHFKDGEFGKSQLHDALAAVHSPTKIVLLDSCFSGALSRKGVQKAPVFELPKAEYDEPSGSIFITASSDREYSYESEDLKGSVFTYHMVAGLSGEADSSGDGVVTVDELYQYVYRETKLHSLLFPSPSMQTPEFVSQLAGRGAIALSFPAETNAKLMLDSDIGGQVTIASRDGIQIFKVDKLLGLKKNIQLPAGRYEVSVNQGFRVGQADLRLMPKKLAMLDGSTMTWQDHTQSIAAKKGGEAPTRQFGILVGRHSGFNDNQSPGAYLGMSALSANTPQPAAWRLLGSLAAESHVNRADGDWADIQIGGALAGGALEIANPWTQLPQQFRASLQGGLAFERQTWHYTDRNERTFQSVMPALSLGLSYGVRWPESPVRWSLEARRDFQFARDTQSGRRKFAANFFGIGAEF